jgi:hypothetical protein
LAETLEEAANRPRRPGNNAVVQVEGHKVKFSRAHAINLIPRRPDRVVKSECEKKRSQRVTLLNAPFAGETVPAEQ